MPGSDREQAAAPSCPSIGAGMIYRLLFACLVSLSLASSALAQATATQPHEPLAERPLRFEAAIAAFEARDRVDPPPKHAVLLSGASYMLRWTNAAAALAPHPVINRGFGGAYTTEVVRYMDRITLPYEPRVVVFACGGNDIAAGDPPAAPLARIRTYVTRLRAGNPDTAVVFMTTPRAPSRRAKWAEVDTFNRGLAAYCREVDNLSLVDINAVLNEPDGEPRTECYLPDLLHPSERGYVAIATVLKPAVDRAWQATAAAFAGRARE
jgi:lysophospholipase L1-like esterase